MDHRHPFADASINIRMDARTYSGSDGQASTTRERSESL
jgi:hypothetical protein